MEWVADPVPRYGNATPLVSVGAKGRSWRTAHEPGSIPHVRIGSSPRFLPSDLEAWVRTGCPPAADFAEWHRVEEKKIRRN